MPACLGQQPLARIHQQHGQIGVRGACGHVAGILFVPRRVGDDEAPPGRADIAVGDIDDDALFPLRRQPVDQQCQIQRANEAS